MSDKLTPGTRVLKGSQGQYEGVVLCEYLPDVYEVRITSNGRRVGDIVVPRHELTVRP